MYTHYLDLLNIPLILLSEYLVQNLAFLPEDLSTLIRFKDDVREVQQNYECGMSFENYDDIKIGDVIECFEVEEFAPQI